MSHLRDSLAKARGLGSAGEGVTHFWHQRLTALALVPLALWLCFSLAMLPEAGYGAVVHWLQSPVNAVLLMLTLLVSLYHGQLGVQVILEDYVSTWWLRTTLIVGAWFLTVLMMIVGIYSILKVSMATSL
ncbi:MAG TPA: succinate dehydrogenase, hydrophobic membrane anchor protein [Candidatus Tenderia sp.]|nr:succinate dehydrogenase, hydrophobic membrane anchor protein [Candidatus Tenderia sp.]